MALLDIHRLGVAVAAVGCVAITVPTAQDGSLALTHVGVVDVVAGQTRPDETVLIRGDRIVAVGASVAIPAGVREANLSGKFVVLASSTCTRMPHSPPPAMMHRVDGILMMNCVNGFAKAFSASATWVRRLRRYRISRRSRDGALRPRVWFSGHPLTGAVGAEDFHLSVKTPAEARQAVERLVAAGVDFIKVHDWLDQEAHAEVLRTARRFGLRVVGHIPAALTVEDVLDNGQHDVEHLGSSTHGILRSCSNAKVPSPHTLRTRVGDEVAAHAAAMSDAYLTPLLDGFDPDRCRALARRLAQEKVWQVPTLSWWQSVADEPPATWTGPLQRHLTTLLRIVGTMAAEGVPIMTGLDRARGKTIADEIQLLVRAGLTPAAALRAATFAPAEFLGVDESLGAITAGRLADMVILEGDPLDDVNATRRIHGVVADGNLIVIGETRPPVIDMHVHSAQVTPQAFAQLASLNIRSIFLAGVTADLGAWATAADQTRYVPALVLPCGEGRAPGPGAGRACFDSAVEFPDVTWRREEIRAGRIRGLGELAPQFMGMAPNDSRLEPYWQLAEEFDVPVGIHLGPGPPGAAYDSSPSPIKYPAFRMGAGNPLLLEDVLLRHKRLRLFVMHAGWPQLESMLALLYAHPNVYVDVAGLQFPTIVPRDGYYRYLRGLIDGGFGRRVMFGSEFANQLGPGVDAVLAADFLSAQQKADILCNNAARFLRLEASVCTP